MEIATIVKNVTEEAFPEKGEIPIVTTPSNDNRSYRITSDKIAAKLGFTPKRTIEDAVRDLCKASVKEDRSQQPHRRSLLQREDPQEASSDLMKSRPLAVVTGGAGFIGSHMVDLFVERGFRVHVIDSLIGGRATTWRNTRRTPTSCWMNGISGCSRRTG